MGLLLCGGLRKDFFFFLNRELMGKEQQSTSLQDLEGK